MAALGPIGTSPTRLLKIAAAAVRELSSSSLRCVVAEPHPSARGVALAACGVLRNECCGLLVCSTQPFVDHDSAFVQIASTFVANLHDNSGGRMRTTTALTSRLVSRSSASSSAVRWNGRLHDGLSLFHVMRRPRPCKSDKQLHQTDQRPSPSAHTGDAHGTGVHTGREVAVQVVIDGSPAPKANKSAPVASSRNNGTPSRRWLIQACRKLARGKSARSAAGRR